jgi:hypothetical protein
MVSPRDAQSATQGVFTYLADVDRPLSAGDRRGLGNRASPWDETDGRNTWRETLTGILGFPPNRPAAIDRDRAGPRAPCNSKSWLRVGRNTAISNCIAPM